MQITKIQPNNIYYNNQNITANKIINTEIAKPASNNQFATIVMNSATGNATGASGSKLTFKNCTIEARNVEDISEMALLDIRTKVEVEFEGCSFKVNGAETELTICTEGDYTDASATESIVTVDGNSVDLTNAQ